MISTAKTAKIFVGVDVSKAKLDVYRPDTKELLKIENSEDAINKLCSLLEKREAASDGCNGRNRWLRIPSYKAIGKP